MKTLSTLTLLSGLASSPLPAVEPPPAGHSLFQAIRAGDAAKVDVLLIASGHFAACDDPFPRRISHELVK